MSHVLYSELCKNLLQQNQPFLCAAEIAAFLLYKQQIPRPVHSVCQGWQPNCTEPVISPDSSRATCNIAHPNAGHCRFQHVPTNERLCTEPAHHLNRSAVRTRFMKRYGRTYREWYADNTAWSTNIDVCVFYSQSQIPISFLQPVNYESVKLQLCQGVQQ